MPSESTVRSIVEQQGAQAVTMEPDYQLIETMRWEPLSGVLRFDLHMARLENSARELGFPAIWKPSDRRLSKAEPANKPSNCV